METTFFFSRDSEAVLGTQSATMGGSFWTRIRLGKAVAGPGVRGQDDRDKWKQTSFFLGIQRRRLAPKVRPWEARFGPELAPGLSNKAPANSCQSISTARTEALLLLFLLLLLLILLLLLLLLLAILQPRR